MSDFFLGIEVHDRSIWDVERMKDVVDTMERYGYNALILHWNDYLDLATQLGMSENFGVSDLRLKKTANHVAWLKDLCRRLGAFNAGLYLEVKEPSYHDYVLGLYPDLVDDKGALDPTHPKWLEICRAKTEQIFDAVPDMAGLILNVSSPESRVSLQDYLADHDIEIDMAAWLTQMIDSFHQPLSARDKTLYVRDFAYTTEYQKKTLEVIDTYDGAVGASIKITPHDYFPKFANNAIAHEVKAPKLIEFEAYGEHMGWGVIPNIRVGEFVERMQFVRDIGAEGLFVRISWEAMTGPHALDTLSDVNVYALAALSRPGGETLRAADIVQDWLVERYGLKTGDDVTVRLSHLLLDSWYVVSAAYWNDSVFPRHSRLPSSWQEGWHSMQTAGMGNRLMEDAAFSISEGEKAELFAEKDAAVQKAKAIAEGIQGLLDHVPQDLSHLLSQGFSWLPIYAALFESATIATVLAAEGGSEDEIREYQNRLYTHAELSHRRLQDGFGDVHTAHILFDPEHICRFADSLILEES